VGVPTGSSFANRSRFDSPMKPARVGSQSTALTISPLTCAGTYFGFGGAERISAAAFSDKGRFRIIS
jgi:hypothetical protein